jgi:5-(carboxyamino)imidazole ribonucleotide mutase
MSGGRARRSHGPAAERPPPAPGERVPVVEPIGDMDPDVETEVEDEFAELDVDAPLVGIVMGSKSDMEKMEKAGKELEERGIRYEIRVMSAHRDPDVVADYAKNAKMRGLRVIIAGAGLAAALPGVVAAHTELPVIGVPLSSSTSVAGGLDALLAIAQMPPGVPVACVAVDGARNAAILAAKILQG